MINIFLWAGIVLILIGWLALAWQASKRMAIKEELEKFPDKSKIMKQRRNNCFLIIFAGVVLLLLALVM